jgi:hypothetical protein
MLDTNVALILQKWKRDIVVTRACAAFDYLNLHDADLCKKSDGQRHQEAISRIIGEEYGLTDTVEIDDKRTKLRN